MTVSAELNWAEAGALDEVLAGEKMLTDPYPAYRRLQRESPVHWATPWNAWIATQHKDVSDILRDGSLWSTSRREGGRAGWNLRHLTESQRGELRALQDHYKVGLLSADPPDHTRMKNTVKHRFTPRAVEEHNRYARSVADRLLEDVRGLTEFDLIERFAHPMPSVVVHEVMGFSADDIDTVTSWAEDIIGILDSNRPEFAACVRAQAGLLEARKYIRELLEARRRRPKNDILSAFAQVGDQMSEAEIVSTLVTFLTGGDHTTTALIGNGMLRLMQQPVELHALMSDRGLLPVAVEEFLRIESPAQRVTRFARETTQVGDATVQPDVPVIVAIGAANRDPAVFSSPDELDIRRQPNRHLAFAAGVHSCIGAPLARVEAVTAFASLFDHLEDIELVEPIPDWLPIHAVRFLRRLPVRVKWRKRVK